MHTFKAKFLIPGIARARGRLSTSSGEENMRLCRMRVTNSRCEVATTINCYIYIIKTYFIDDNRQAVCVVVGRFILQKY